MDSMRYLDAEGVKPPSALDRQLERLIPSIISKSMSELAPHADSMRVIYGNL